MSTRAQEGDLKASHILRDYTFLSDVLPKHRLLGVRRAQATFAIPSDLSIHH